ncbi:AtpZ/AtpI family protein [Sneathiella limimaris]|uniref:AtpZ/AtpI family protein n=1 Tax=Sneathiella limimaris TaxID=1964213 RepID=UPI001469FB97|nr:AtpZ/AtpI family protein [Sneathiella limimaris]
MTDSDPDEKKEFKARLEKARKEHVEKSWDGNLKVEQGSALGRAWRLSVEMIAALIVCGVFGWMLDNWLETRPIFLLVFVVIGMIVGVYNVIKVATRMNQANIDE